MKLSGTLNMDHVISTMNERRNYKSIVATFKHEMTVDITTGIELAVKKVLEHAGVKIKSVSLASGR